MRIGARASELGLVLALVQTRWFDVYFEFDHALDFAAAGLYLKANRIFACLACLSGKLQFVDEAAAATNWSLSDRHAHPCMNVTTRGKLNWRG